MTVGEKIRYYRNIRGISQETLGNQYLSESTSDFTLNLQFGFVSAERQKQSCHSFDK